MEAARTANAQPLAQNPARKQKSGKTDEVVVLSRTDRHGMSRPLPQRAHPQEPRRGRRKREKVGDVIHLEASRLKKIRHLTLLYSLQIKTHGDTGERERYFQDDDAHDLKSLVSVHHLSSLSLDDSASSAFLPSNHENATILGGNLCFSLAPTNNARHSFACVPA